MANVPNTTTFTLSDVTGAVIGIGSNDLVECFAHAVDAQFDATYKGSKNNQYNFRNYTGATPLTSIGNITGNVWQGYTLTAGAVSPGGATVTYQWKKCSTSGGTYTDISGATSSTFVVTASEVGYYIKVSATGTGSYSGTVTSAATSSSVTPVGQTAYTTPGTYTWVCPSGVYSVCAVGIGTPGYANNYSQWYAGALAYKNNISVTPGNSYTVLIKSLNTSEIWNFGYFIDSSTLKFGVSIDRIGDGGGDGGGPAAGGGGGSGSGAGGYSGSGGTGSTDFNGTTNGGAGSGGGGGGGGYSVLNDTGQNPRGAGGGVGLFGAGSNGAGGTSFNGNSADWPMDEGGRGGSSGTAGQTTTDATSTGGDYGGSSGNPYYSSKGACRIIWGANRSYPSTNLSNK